MILIHPSSLGKIMTEPKTKAAKEAGELSETAKTYLTGLAKEQVYGYRASISNKYLEKGIRCEQDSIDLYNAVFFTMHQKNDRRFDSDILTGEPDIIDTDLIIDIKTSWSLETFPATKDQAHDDGYEWQGRAYMMLADKSRFELAFCMVSTPEDLCRYESPDVHCVDHIPPHMRITRVLYERDQAKEEAITQKCKMAQKFVQEMIQRINDEHRG